MSSSEKSFRRELSYMKKGNEELVREWFEKGEADFQTARFLHENRKYPEIIVFHIQQAVEKYLKGFLISKGWKLEKTHDLVKLLNQAVTCNQDLQRFKEYCQKLTEYYIESRYPIGITTEYTHQEIEDAIGHAQEIIESIKALTQR